MHVSRRSLRTLLTLLCLSTVAVQAADPSTPSSTPGQSSNLQTLRPAGADWSLTLPPGWRAAPEFLEKLNAQFAELSITDPDFLYALLPDDGRPIYAVVQRVPGPPSGSTYEDIEKSFGAGSSVAQSKSDAGLRDAFSTIDFSAPLLDRERNRILIKLKTVGTDGKENLGFSEGAIGKSGIILIHCYAPTDLAPASMPDFRNIWSGFRFDPDRAYAPPGASSPSSPAWNTLLIAVFAGLAIALGFVIARKLAQQKNAPNT